jgi:hypothetical protein
MPNRPIGSPASSRGITDSLSRLPTPRVYGENSLQNIQGRDPKLEDLIGQILSVFNPVHSARTLIGLDRGMSEGGQLPIAGPGGSVVFPEHGKGYKHATGSATGDVMFMPSNRPVEKMDVDNAVAQRDESRRSFIPKAVYELLNNARVKAKDTIGEAIVDFAGPDHDPGNDSASSLHTAVSRDLTSGLGRILPPTIASNVSDLAGLGNETLSGVLQKLISRPFQSAQGFDWGDVQSNRTGQDQGIRELENNPPGTLWSGDNPLKGVQDAVGLTLAEEIAKYLKGSKQQQPQKQKPDIDVLAQHLGLGK